MQMESQTCPAQASGASAHLAAQRGLSPTGPCPRPRPTLQRVRRSACKGGLFICLIKRRLPAAFGSICFTYSHVPAKLNTINTGRLKAKGRLETHRQTQEPHGAA